MNLPTHATKQGKEEEQHALYREWQKSERGRWPRRAGEEKTEANVTEDLWEEGEDEPLPLCTGCADKESEYECAKCTKPICEECLYRDESGLAWFVVNGDEFLCHQCTNDACNLFLGRTIQYMKEKNGSIAKMVLR